MLFIIPGQDKACLERLKAVALRYAADLSEQTGIAVRISPSVMEDVYASAAASIGFHNIESGNWNHYKEIAHIAYWFQKLKPVRFRAPQGMVAFAKGMVLALGDSVFGNSAGYDEEFAVKRATFDSQITSHGHRLQSKYQTALIIPLNEILAVWLIKDFMTTASREIEKNLVSSMVKVGYRARFADISEQFERQTNELAMGLRYHNFTVRGFATMIETIFKIRAENELAG